MYDNFGLPFYPIVFQILMVLTFALHILFVNLTWGGTFLSFYFNFKKEEKYKNLSFTLRRSIPALLSIAILLGIAPLLFIQTIYDYFWYNSNIFSGIFVLLFIFSLMAGFSLVYYHYLSSKNPNWAQILAFILLTFSAFIMHVLNVQLLQNQSWGTFWNPSSLGKLHYFEIYRFLHFLVPSFALTGFFLILNSWYLKKKGVLEEIYDFRAKLGAKIFFYFTIIQALVGVWWLLMIPKEFKFYLNHFFILGIVLFLILLYFSYKALKNPFKNLFPLSILVFITVLIMAINRESLRVLYLKEGGFSLSNYPLNIHYPSLILFLITFLLAIFVSVFLITVVFKGGLKEGILEEDNSLKILGKFSIIGLLLWIGIVGIFGIIIYVKNL